MAEGTDAIRAHHGSLLECLLGAVDKIEQMGPGDYKTGNTSLESFAEFLKDDLMPHAEGEERSLYPAVKELVCKYDNPLATMSLDHEAIVDRIKRFADTVAGLKLASDEEITPLVRQAQRLAIELGALVSVHLSKEEIALLPLMDQYMSPEDAKRVVEDMH